MLEPQTGTPVDTSPPDKRPRFVGRSHGFDYHYFDDPAGLGYRGYRQRLPTDRTIRPWELVARVCVAARMRSAIDLGCAKGFLVERLIAHGIKATGYDISAYALSFAKGLPCHERDIRDGELGNADAIIALGVFMYVEERELSSLLDNVCAACRRTLIASNYYAGNRQLVPDSLRRITRPHSWWRQSIENAGFRLRNSGRHFDIFVPA